MSGLKNVAAGDLTGVGTISNDDAKTQLLVGNLDSVTLTDAIASTTREIGIKDDFISRGNISFPQRIVIDGITQPDLIATNYNPIFNIDNLTI